MLPRSEPVHVKSAMIAGAAVPSFEATVPDCSVISVRVTDPSWHLVGAVKCDCPTRLHDPMAGEKRSAEDRPPSCAIVKRMIAVRIGRRTDDTTETPRVAGGIAVPFALPSALNSNTGIRCFSGLSPFAIELRIARTQKKGDADPQDVNLSNHAARNAGTRPLITRPGLGHPSTWHATHGRSLEKSHWV